MEADDAILKAKELALGRILRMASRPSRRGDAAEYWRCRAIIMTDAPEFVDTRPNWAKQRNSGAQGN